MFEGRELEPPREVETATELEPRSANQPRAGGGPQLAEADKGGVTEKGEPQKVTRPEGALQGASMLWALEERAEAGVAAIANEYQSGGPG